MRHKPTVRVRSSFFPFFFFFSYGDKFKKKVYNKCKPFETSFPVCLFLMIFFPFRGKRFGTSYIHFFNESDIRICLEITSSCKV